MNSPIPTRQQIPKPFPWLASLVYGAVLLAGLYYRGAGLCRVGIGSWAAAALTAVLFFLLGLEQWERRRYGLQTPQRVAIGLLATRMLLFEVVVAADCSGFSKFLYLVVPFVAYFCLGKRVSYGLAVFYIGLVAVRLFLIDPDWYLTTRLVSDVLILGIGLLFVLAMAGVVRNEDVSRRRAEALLADLAQSHEQLRLYAAQAAELATAAERNRLARDIHDSLGHHLTVINIQLEKAQAFRQRQPEEAEQAVREAKRAAAAALQDARQSVGALRQGERKFSLAAALPQLVANMNHLNIGCQIKGEEKGFSQTALLTLYRAAQEGLTNIQKHARASQVQLQLEFTEDKVTLSIYDDGQGFDPAELSTLPPDRLDRFGLQGIQERVELSGGTMTLTSENGKGVSLVVVVPRE